MTATTSLAIYALHEANLRVGLVASGMFPVTVPSERGKPHQYQLQEVLAEVRAGSAALSDQLAKLDRQFGPGQVVVLITAHGPAVWGTWLGRLFRRGVATRIVEVRQGAAEPSRESIGAARWSVPAIYLPVELARVAQERTLVSYLEGRDAAAD